MPSGSLIPGLPDDIAKLCLASIPRRDVRTCKLVCSTWMHYFDNIEFVKLRRDRKLTELWYFKVAESGRLGCVPVIEAFDPVSNSWSQVPDLPSSLVTYSNLSSFSCVSVEECLFVLGGKFFHSGNYIPSKRVYKFDCYAQKWTRMEDMHHARYNFLCASFGRKIVVAGSHTELDVGSSQTAEIFDVDLNQWTELPKLANGVMSSGYDHRHIAFFTGRDTVVIMGMTKRYNYFPFALSFQSLHLESLQWIQDAPEWDWWPEEVALVNGELFRVQNGLFSAYDFDSNDWVSGDCQAALIGLICWRGKLFALAADGYALSYSRNSGKLALIAEAEFKWKYSSTIQHCDCLVPVLV